jgi:hypothetical protein
LIWPLPHPRRAFALALFAAFLACAPAAAAERRATPLDPANRGTSTIAPIRDSVIHGRGALHAAAVSGNGGYFTTPTGESVKVLSSRHYTYDPSVNQSYADFLASLVHGKELHKVTVYIAPYSEMQQVCGSTEDDACYYDDEQLLVVTGDSPPGGTPIENLAAHEYGHHVARNRRNDLGYAGDWGPEYWATYQDVCNRESNGTAYPGDEGKHYDLNPGEAWAEAYRVLNGYGTNVWDIVDPSFKPDAQAKSLARRDVLNPYLGGEYTARSGKFKKTKKHRWRYYTVPVENDGIVDLRLKGKGSLDADLYVYDMSGKELDHKATDGHNEHYHDTYCAYRKLQVGVHRYSGKGSFNLRITLPYFS